MLGPQNSTFVMYDEEFKRISVVIDKLLREANAKVIFLVDKNGQLIAGCGETEHLDTTSLASLTAGNIAATGGLAKLIGEKEFSILFHEGEKDNFHISIVAQRVILVVIFDDLAKKTASAAEQGGGPDSPFAEITDDDIDNLFS